jgi:hypothetical protein
MRNVSDKTCREDENTKFVFSNFSSENHGFYAIMWKNMVEDPDRQQMTVYYGACALHDG